LLFITGAGISADSGLPTYRGIGGLYNHDQTEEGISIEEALSGETLITAPEITWKYLARIEAATRQARCNRGHQVIAEMEAHFKRVWTLTQNIDGLHRQAGGRNILEIHGNLHNLRCSACGYAQAVDDYSRLKLPPGCPQCQGALRPAVVLFGEMLPPRALAKLQVECAAGFDAVLSIGTTSVFPYIAQPVAHAKSRNKPTIEINPSQTCVTQLVDIKLPLKAAAALDEIWRRYKLITAS
jgi:NAD-dependent deacetylase